MVRSNQEYDYFDNVLEYDYFAFWTNVLEYEYDYSESTSTEYNYSISDISGNLCLPLLLNP